MKIETKFNIGQEVYFMFNNKVQHAEVLEIDVTVTHLNKECPDAKINCRYEVNFKDIVGGGFKFYEEYELFVSKEELLKSL